MVAMLYALEVARIQCCQLFVEDVVAAEPSRAEPRYTGLEILTKPEGKKARFETQKYIIIQMEHLKGMQMKREMRHRTLQARQRNTKAEELDSDSEHNYDDKNNSPNKLNEKKGKDKNNNQEESFDQ